MKYNRLTIIKKYRKDKKTIAQCICDCGNKKDLEFKSIKSGNTKSCGCLQKELASIRLKKRRTTHGESKTYFYKRWWHMRARCKFIWDKDYKNYGAKGIKCLWENYIDFKNDMYESYLKHSKKYGDKDTTIERINYKGNYCKDNCRWATFQEQARNKSNNRLITHGKNTKTLSEWARYAKMSHEALAYRLSKGLSIEEAITLPLNHGNKYHK